jgi:cytochrome c oxidase subunit 1
MAPARLAALGVRDQPQGHRHAVPVFSFAMFIVGGMALVIRAELFQPGLQFVNPEFFNQIHDHARPDHGVRRHHAGLRGLRELDDPDADRRARHGVRAHEQLSFWLLRPPPSCWWRPSSCPAAPAAGWTLYPPLTLQMGRAWTWHLRRAHPGHVSSIMGSINIITTMLNMRAPGMTLMKMPLFCWTWLITAYLLIAVMPVLAGASRCC